MFAWKQKTNARSTISCVMMNATERSSRTDFNLHKTWRKICCIILSSSDPMWSIRIGFCIQYSNKRWDNNKICTRSWSKKQPRQTFLQIKSWHIFLSSNRFLHVKVHKNINNNHQVFSVAFISHTVLSNKTFGPEKRKKKMTINSLMDKNCWMQGNVRQPELSRSFTIEKLTLNTC